MSKKYPVCGSSDYGIIEERYISMPEPEYNYNEFDIDIQIVACHECHNIYYIRN